MKENIQAICIVTGSRAEFGLLNLLIKKLFSDNKFSINLLVTGTHLSEKYGRTIKEIEEQDIPISKLIDLNIDKDSRLSVTHSISIGIDKFGSVYKELKPDLLSALKH